MTFLPETAPAPEVETLNLDALAAEALVMLAGDDSALATTLATLPRQYRNAAKVSAVSPDWLTNTAQDLSESTGSR